VKPKNLRGWARNVSGKDLVFCGLLLLITLFAAILRFYKLGEWSFWIDEIFTINHATSHFSTLGLIIQNIPPARNWVPISVIGTAQALRFYGVNEWGARLVPALIGSLSIPILYFPTAKMFGRWVALGSLLLLAISPWHIFWSQNARFYPSLMLFYTLALFAFYFGIERDKPGYLFLFFLFVYFAASERLSALFVFPVIVAYLLALWVFRFERPPGLNLRNILVIGSPVLLGSVIELFSRLVDGESRFFADFGWFLQYKIDDPLRLLVFTANNLGVPFAVMAVMSGLFLFYRKNRAGLLMLTSAMVPLLILLVANFFIFTKDRYVFITQFSWIVLTVAGIAEIVPQLKGKLRWLAAGIFLVFFAHAANDMLLYYQVNQGNRLQWRSAFTLVKDRAGDQDNVVAYWPEFSPLYIDRKIIPYQDIELSTVQQSKQSYWFVLDSETIWLNADLKAWLENNAQLVNVWYLRRPEENYLRVYFFDPASRKSP
jgi:4-amino-4-deoxy-L-arabinose transferase-like glycosyltransferase